LIRVKPNEVVINDREAFVTIHRQGTKFYKEENFYNSFKGIHGNLFNIQDPEDHSRRKRLMSPSFSSASLLTHQDIIYASIEPALEAASRLTRLEKQVPLFPIIRKFALDSISAFAFGFDSANHTHVDDNSARKIFSALDASPHDLLVVSNEHFVMMKC
jgi:cytochrome P450